MKQQLEAEKKDDKRILEIEEYVDNEEDCDCVEDDQNNSAILEESSVKVKHIHKTENMFEKKNRSVLPISDRLKSIVSQIE